MERDTVMEVTPEDMLLQPEERVLSTLEADGSRRWLYPRLARGRFHTARTILGYGLIAFSVILPFVEIGNHPAILIDVVHRRLYLMGFTFAPTDTVLLALGLLSAGLGIFFFTALFGRVWCGWACPQTVYLELVYRPLERLFHGTAGRGGEPRASLPLWRRVAYLASAFVLSVAVGNLFLSYFVGAERIAHWVRRSPLEHPVAFLVMTVASMAMMLDFTWFREQFCILACPYGRFQSVLVDRDTLQVRYDRARGEPRAKGSRREASLVARGSCVDCGLCAKVCPTGIDVRDGVQLECVGCAQCIDACETVMRKVDGSAGLIRYSTEARDAGDASQGIRPRLVLYPILLGVLGILIGGWFLRRAPVDLTLLRSPGLPFLTTPEGRIANNLRLKLVDRSGAAGRYEVRLHEDSGAVLTMVENPVMLEGGASTTCGLVISVPPSAFRDGRHVARIRVVGDQGLDRTIEAVLLGPNKGGTP